MPEPRIVIFTRYPVPGQAKTRLIPALGEAGAAALHRRLAEQTVDVARASGLAVELRYTGGTAEQFADWLGEDIDLVEQGEGDLGERMCRASAELPMLFIGSDCPDLAVQHLRDAAAALETAEAVVGPAEDGGYWLLGLVRRCDFLFADMAWGTDAVLPETLARLTQHGIQPAMLDTLSDCDTPEDLARWPELTQ